MSIQNLKNNISAYCEANKIMCMVRITRKDEILLDMSCGYADLDKKTPFSEKSIFTFYSLSKPFCAIGLMKLFEKGLVDLNAHPSKYVPECNGLDARVKVSHLLNHTSGLPDFEQEKEFKEQYAPGYSKNIRTHLALIKDFPQSFEPGTENKYANINFIICALIIENISGQSYSEYMQNEVFKPFEMNDAIIDNENTDVSSHVKGYELKDGMLKEIFKSRNWLLGAGDIVGTINDVYCLNKAIKNNLMLKKETWDKILTPSPVNHMGYGCNITKLNGKKRITHNGGHTGFRTLHVQIPEDDFDIIILSNSGFGNARNDITDMIYNEFYSLETADKIEMDKGYAKN